MTDWYFYQEKESGNIIYPVTTAVVPLQRRHRRRTQMNREEDGGNIQIKEKPTRPKLSNQSEND